MKAFENARALIAECERIFPELDLLYQESVRDKQLNATVCIKVKTFLEHLRAALDYCATAIYKKYGDGKPSHKPYFPYATSKNRKSQFRTEVLERALPGVAAARPDICDILENYQYFGRTGDWLPAFMELANEHKHREFTPQARKTYTMVEMSVRIPPKTKVRINLKKIRLGGQPDSGYCAKAFKVTTYEFITTGELACMFFENALRNIRRIVDELAAAYAETAVPALTPNSLTIPLPAAVTTPL